MTVEEIEQVVHACTQIQWPRKLRHGVPSKLGDGELVPLTGLEKIEVLEDFMLLNAEARNNCENARIHISGSLRILREKWDNIVGWEVALKGNATRPSAAAVDAAKATVAPDLAPSLKKAEWLMRRLDQQIARCAKNEETVSRIYTFSVGS